MKNKIKISPGDVYAKLTVMHEIPKHILPSGQKIRKIHCKCSCGNEKDVLLLHLVRGRATSCGCAYRTKNGESNSPIYKTWYKMHNRCKPDYFERHLYFEKGISVCKEWDDFFVFKEWASNNGHQKSLQLDREDNSKGYSPENCRFVTNLINANNRDNNFYVTYRGEIVSLSLKLHELGKRDHYYTIRSRIKRGWDTDRAIDTPIKKGNYRRKSFKQTL